MSYGQVLQEAMQLAKAEQLRMDTLLLLVLSVYPPMILQEQHLHGHLPKSEIAAHIYRQLHHSKQAQRLSPMTKAPQLKQLPLDGLIKYSKILIHQTVDQSQAVPFINQIAQLD